MKILILTLAVVGIAAGAQAATEPGTIISTVATAAYADSTGQPMPQQSSNPANILVVSGDPTERPVMMTIRSLYYGPSTIGRTIKLAGRVVTDAEGTWIEDGSEEIHYDPVTGEPTQITKLRCKIFTLFVAENPAIGEINCITGISQVEPDGTPIIIPPSNTCVQSITP